MAPSAAISNCSEIQSLEDWAQNPPKAFEWVNGALVEKHPLIWISGEAVEDNGMTLKNSRIQARLANYWINYKNIHEPAGEVYTEAPCRTLQQGRVPDVAYLTPTLVEQYGDCKTLPQSFPLSAEIISPTDFAEDVIAKAQEYLQSGGEEVWLIFPESQWVIVATENQRHIFISGEMITTQKVLPGFTIAVDKLLA